MFFVGNVVRWAHEILVPQGFRGVVFFVQDDKLGYFAQETLLPSGQLISAYLLIPNLAQQELPILLSTAFSLAGTRSFRYEIGYWADP